MKKLFFLGFCAMVGMGIISLSSCSKDGADGFNGLDGTNGTDGKNGVAGAQGPAGVVGAQGPQGTPGSANLKSSTVTITDWVYDEITHQYMGFTINNNITNHVLEGGLVQVFLRTSDGRYIALPATFYPSAGVSFKTGFSLMLQQVRIELQYPDLEQGPMPGMLTFKVVAMGSGFTSIHKNLDFSDYNQLIPFLSSTEQ
jgi:Collagen triple helix repeat (20 copies)